VWRCRRPRSPASPASSSRAPRTARRTHPAACGEPAPGGPAGPPAPLGGPGDATALVGSVERTRDPHVRVRRAAINALGKLGGDRALATLNARWDGTDVTPDERRALVEALGKIGDESTRGKLDALATGDDAELERRKQRALLMLARTRSRGAESAIDVDAKGRVRGLR